VAARSGKVSALANNVALMLIISLRVGAVVRCPFARTGRRIDGVA
jgi:hypothetical protein